MNGEQKQGLTVYLRPCPVDVDGNFAIQDTGLPVTRAALASQNIANNIPHEKAWRAGATFGLQAMEWFQKDC